MRGRWAGFTLCVLFVLALRLAFLYHPVQGDDLYYLAGAQHAQIDPLHPHHARYAFQGTMVEMRGHPHPPLNAWVLGSLLAATRDVSEPVFHLAYIAFSLIAAASMWSLARRFSVQPLAATFLFLVTPVFVVNGSSLETDVPFVAFWLASIAFYVAAADAVSTRWLLASAAMMVLAAMTSFQAVFLAPVLGAYLWLHKRRWMPGWIVLTVPALVIAFWQFSEKLIDGALPAAVLVGYFQSYGLQQLSMKLRNAAALTVHLAWLVFPALAVAAFFRVPKWALFAVSGAAAALFFVDTHPLFWVSWAIGALIVVNCCFTIFRDRDPETRFLCFWVAVFYFCALAIFYAGAARYLLPVAAPVALLVVRRFSGKRTWLVVGGTFGFAIALSLALSNYQHWEAYRRFVARFSSEIASTRTWVDADWGMRFYAEAEGGLPLMRDTHIQPGDLVLTSELGSIHLPVRGERTLLGSEEIRPWPPFRIIGIYSRSSYSTHQFGLRPFDISTAPIDQVRAELAVHRQPVLEYLSMNAPETAHQIISGLSDLEDNWRWTALRAIVTLKSPSSPLPLEASLHIPDQAKARRIQLWLDGRSVAEATYGGPGSYILRSPPVTPANASATAMLVVDQTFRAPYDERDLGVILRGIGFKP